MIRVMVPADVRLLRAPDDAGSSPDAGDDDGASVLARLPRTRPQRASARRGSSGRAPRSSALADSAPAADGDGKAGAELSSSAASAPSRRRKPSPAPKTSAAAPKSAAATPRSPGAAPKSSTAAPKGRPARRNGVAGAEARRKVGATGAGSRRTARPAVPRQGYEADGERATGPVEPPGGVELLATAGEIVSEIAKAGVATGERVLRDLFGRLPL
jgi:hypothetical protein